MRGCVGGPLPWACCCVARPAVAAEPVRDSNSATRRRPTTRALQRGARRAGRMPSTRRRMARSKVKGLSGRRARRQFESLRPHARRRDRHRARRAGAVIVAIPEDQCRDAPVRGEDERGSCSSAVAALREGRHRQRVHQDPCAGGAGLPAAGRARAKAHSRSRRYEGAESQRRGPRPLHRDADACAPVPISLQPGELYPSLQHGLVQAVAQGWPSVQAFHLDEVTNFHLEVPLGMNIGYVFMNKEVPTRISRPRGRRPSIASPARSMSNVSTTRPSRCSRSPSTRRRRWPVRPSPRSIRRKRRAGRIKIRVGDRRVGEGDARRRQRPCRLSRGSRGHPRRRNSRRGTHACLGTKTALRGNAEGTCMNLSHAMFDRTGKCGGRSGVCRLRADRARRRLRRTIHRRQRRRKRHRANGQRRHRRGRAGARSWSTASA